MLFAVRLSAVGIAALALAGAASAKATPKLAAPQGLKPFLLRADERPARTFSRTPAFAWSPVAGAKTYEFQLSTSSVFRENGIVWSDDTLKSPAVAIPISLPWITGSPYSLYARVRALTSDRASAWTKPYGFNMRWPNVPAPLPAQPGLIRWTPVEGATHYEVWMMFANGTNKRFSTLTNVADLREAYSFHQSPAWIGSVSWRIRALRWLYGASRNGLPAVSYGPWSPTYGTTNPAFATGPMAAAGTVSDVASTAGQPTAHKLMPAFVFSGNQSLLGTTAELYRIYVFTDQDCLNVVYRGAIVGSPAYAPRTTGPLSLPKDPSALSAARTSILKDGEEGLTYTFDRMRVKTTESQLAPAAPAGGGATGGSAGSGGSTGSTGGSAGSSPTTGGSVGRGTSFDASDSNPGALVDLWDSNWPHGRYYWTVVPVEVKATTPVISALAGGAAAGSTTIMVGSPGGIAVGDSLTIGPPSNSETAIVRAISGGAITLASPLRSDHGAGEPVIQLSGSFEYQDLELAQDVCASGRVLSFGKVSEPVVTASSAPFVSGLSPRGRLVAAARKNPSLYGAPLVAWQPALGADGYEVQWSKTRYPWKKVGEQMTQATTASLPLTPGNWFYRVRGINLSLPGSAPQMSWSDPVAITIARPTFSVVHSK